MTKFPYKRTFIISDVHFGVHSNSSTWLTEYKKYFTEFLIPFINKHKREGDCLHILGDVYENRQSLNLLVINTSRSLFKSLASIIPVHIIVGNHDLYKKNSTEISSIEVIEDIPNIKIWKEPAVVKYNKSKVLLMPWRKDEEAEAECILNHDADYLFCHTNISGLKYNKKVLLEHGLDNKLLVKFKKVLSGHIHYRQHQDNIYMLGNIMQTRRSDAYNEKGVYLLDFETDELSFYENHVSPKFLKLNLDNLLSKTVDEIINIIKDNYVDIYVQEDYLISNSIDSLIKSIDGHAKRLEVIPISKNETEVEIEQRTNNILDMCHEYIQNLNYDSDFKDKLYTELETIYNQIIL